jgi:hypothetical protein
MLSNSLIEQLNMNRRTGHIAIKVVSADSFCSVVWWGARAACAEVSTGSVEASKANLGFGSPMALRIHGRVIVSIHYHATHYRNNRKVRDVWEYRPFQVYRSNGTSLNIFVPMFR